MRQEDTDDPDTQKCKTTDNMRCKFKQRGLKESRLIAMRQYKHLDILGLQMSRSSACMVKNALDIHGSPQGRISVVDRKDLLCLL